MRSVCHLCLFDFICRQLFLDKFKFTLDGVLGHPFGTTFELRDRQLVKVELPVFEETGKEIEGIYLTKLERSISIRAYCMLDSKKPVYNIGRMH